MKKNFKYAALLLAAAMLTGMVACSKKQNSTGGTSQPGTEKITGAPSASSGTDAVTDAPSDDGLTAAPHSVWEQYTEGDDQLILYSINCPDFSGNSDWNLEKINNTIEEYCKEYAKISDSDRVSAKEDYDNLGDRFESYEKASDYKYYIKGSVLSVKFEAYESTGGADDLWITTAFCFDLVTGERLDLGAFLGKDSDYAKQYEISAFSLLINTAPDNYFENAVDALPELIDGYGFYLNETGLVMFLNSCTIAPDAFGQQTVTVAYANLPA